MARGTGTAHDHVEVVSLGYLHASRRNLNGPHPEDGRELEVRDEMPSGFPWPEMPDEPQIRAPGEINPEMLNYYAKKLG